MARNISDINYNDVEEGVELILETLTDGEKDEFLDMIDEAEDFYPDIEDKYSKLELIEDIKIGKFHDMRDTYQGFLTLLYAIIEYETNYLNLMQIKNIMNNSRVYYLPSEEDVALSAMYAETLYGSTRFDILGNKQRVYITENDENGNPIIIGVEYDYTKCNDRLMDTGNLYVTGFQALEVYLSTR